MIKLFKELKYCGKLRDHYRISPGICFKVDRRRYILAIIPTIRIVPWIYLPPNCIGVVDVWWLCYHIYIGRFEMKEKTDGKGEDNDG